MRWIAMFAVRLYQHFAPQGTRDRCLYNPTCSDYALTAFLRFGFVRGALLSMKRYRTCRPPNGGDDPVPGAQVSESVNG